MDGLNISAARDEMRRAVASAIPPRPEPEQPKANGKAGIRSSYWTLDDIAELEPPDWLIEGLIPRSAKAIIFGESGHYKSIHAVDLFCRAAHGMDYHGLETAACPVCFIANEDAYGLAVHHVQGWHRYYGKPTGRVIVSPGNTKLDTPEDVQRAIDSARDAFGEERAAFVIDTWDRSLNGDQNQTTDVNPALTGLDALVSAGAATVTISHSPWSAKDRTKGSVTFWANHDARLKAEKDEATNAARSRSFTTSTQRRDWCLRSSSSSSSSRPNAAIARQL
jgi:hypothetical protein